MLKPVNPNKEMHVKYRARRIFGSACMPSFQKLTATGRSKPGIARQRLAVDSPASGWPGCPKKDKTVAQMGLSISQSRRPPRRRQSDHFKCPTPATHIQIGSGICPKGGCLKTGGMQFPKRVFQNDSGLSGPPSYGRVLPQRQPLKNRQSPKTRGGFPHSHRPKLFE